MALTPVALRDPSASAKNLRKREAKSGTFYFTLTVVWGHAAEVPTLVLQWLITTVQRDLPVARGIP